MTVLNILDFPYVSVGDTVVFRYLTGEKQTGSSSFDILLGVIESFRIQEDHMICVVGILSDEERELTGEKLSIDGKDILCNLFKKPKAGIAYGKEVLNPPFKTSIENHKVTIYPPDSLDAELLQERVEDSLRKYWDILSKKLTTSLKDSVFEIIIQEGDTQKSSFSKKSKLKLNGTLSLKVSFKDPESIMTSLAIALSGLVWHEATPDLKNEWLLTFAEEFSFDKLDAEAFKNTFIKFLFKKKETPVEQQSNPPIEEEPLCKFILKEIKKIKCLTFKDLKILKDFEGELYIRNNILPEVLNIVRLKEGTKTIPVSNTTALKKFCILFSAYLKDYSNCSEEYADIFSTFLNLPNND